MNKKHILLLATKLAIIGTLMGVFSLLAIKFGIEEKSFWQKYWDVVAGGGLGAIFGVGTFLVVGTVGFVAGPAIYGTIGLATMLLGGALGGLGIGAVVNILRNPNNYNYNWLIVISIMAGGLIISYCASQAVGRLIEAKINRPER